MIRLALLGTLLLVPLACVATSGPSHPAAQRFEENPIIRPEMLPSRLDGRNINGPSLIRVPDWVPNPLGKYYLYFSSHEGTYIRLAYADDLHGPWKIHKPGVLHVRDVERIVGSKRMPNAHVAAPDVHVDEERQEIRLYYRAYIRAWKSRTTVAFSRDGLHFDLGSPKVLGNPYMRVFRWGWAYYSIDRDGELRRSPDGLTPFEQGNVAFADPVRTRFGTIRHSAVKLDGDVLTVFFSRIGDRPESILMSKVHLTGDWKSWRMGAPVTVLAPEKDYEGGRLRIQRSRKGKVNTPVRQLRDPGIFREAGRCYLLYSVAGEHGIAIAEIPDDL